MLNNNHNSSCGFTEHLVAYLYDEATPAERNEFEIHLINCSSCADEVTDLGSIRSSIADWREEFFTFEQPVIEIPHLKQPLSSINQTVSIAKRSWFADFRKSFLLSPMWKPAAAASALMFVCIGLALYVFVLSGNRELAVNTNKNIEKAAPSSNITTDPQLEKTEILSPNESPVGSRNTEVADSQPNVLKQNKNNSPAYPVTKTSGNTIKLKMIAPKSNTLAIRSETNTYNEKTPVTQKHQVPKLSDLNEDDDKKSLRLADLFEEIGSK